MISIFDEASRPAAPDIPGVTEAQRQQGRRLSQYHAIHLREFERLRVAIAMVEQTPQAAAAILSGVEALSMRDNLRRCGSICGGACEMLTIHHMIEDEEFFPALVRGVDGLRKVIERLSLEHRAIQKRIESVEARAAALVEQPNIERLAALRDEFGLLEAGVRSHFAYEEAQLEAAIGYCDLPL